MLAHELSEVEMEKSDGFAPVIDTLAMFRVALPVLVKVTETSELVVERD